MKLCETNNRESESLQAMAVGLRIEWSKLKEELTKIYGRDAISHLIAMESYAETESNNDEETTLSEQN
ncbi:G-box-binding factor [Salix suchowensis]|nr:G-box-binding factor [Salix suchowensis]